MEEVKFVRLECIDINGISRGVLLDYNYYLEKANNGIALYSEILSNFSFNGQPVSTPVSSDEADDFGNSFMYPESTTFLQLPWKPSVGCVLADFHSSSNNRKSTPCPFNPRNICKAQIKKLKVMGFQIYGAFEYEFYTIDENFLPVNEFFNYSSIQASLWAENLAMNIMQNLKKMRISTEIYHCEDGPSQQEITMVPAFGIKCADNATRYKQTVLETSKLHGYSATFMSKPFLDKSGSSGHFNHSLWSFNGENLFYDAQKPNKLSEIAEHWIAGLRYHSNTLMALFCPTTNCYERFKAGIFIPSDNAWGIDDRKTAYRVKNLDHSQTYVENRVSGAAANQYLVMAGCIIAGLDGIKKKMPLEVSRDQDKVNNNNNSKLPTSLQDALDVLMKSELFKNELGEKFLKAFETLKKYEIEEMQNAKSEGVLVKWYREFYRFCT